MIGKRLMALCVAGLMLFGLASCKKKKGNVPKGGASELAIYAINNGERLNWIESIMASFKEEEWVKEKYPNLTIFFQYNDQESYSVDLMKAGKGGNPFDIIFGSYLTQFSTEDVVYNLTDSVYNVVIPGEDVKVMSKLPEAVVQQRAHRNENGGFSYYTLPYSSSLEGIAYNGEKLASYGLEMPVTTDEFLEDCRIVTAEEGFACLSSREGNSYWSYLFNPLVAQYMTPEGYSNFYNGIDQYGRMSNKIFDTKATLRTLEFLQELFKFSNNFIYPGSDDLDFMAAQLQFYKGVGVFMPNGSWLDREMSALVTKARERGDKIYDIRFMRYPIISSIIEVLPDKTITNDETLRKVIRAIDNDATSYEGVSEDDFDYIAQARSIVKYCDNLDCCIPAYSDSLELAADFLVYTASEKGIQAYNRGSLAPSPFRYDLKTKMPELYESMSGFAKSRVDMYYGSASYNHEIAVPTYNTKMYQYGGIQLTRMDYRSFYGNFSQVNENNVISAQTIWQETKDYWTTERFSEALRKAGY